MDALWETVETAAEKAHFESLYVIALAGLEKAAGTLLEDRGIVVGDQPVAIADETAALVEDRSMRLFSPKTETEPTRNSVVNQWVKPTSNDEGMQLEKNEAWLLISSKQRDVENVLDVRTDP